MEFNATFIVSLISFCLFIFAMNNILYAPISKVVSERKKYINDNYKVASDNSSLKEEALNQRKQIIETAHIQSRDEIATKKDEYRKKRDLAIHKAKENVKEQVEIAQDALEQEEKEAHIELKQQIVGLAQMISDKFIATDEKVESNDEIICKIL